MKRRYRDELNDFYNKPFTKKEKARRRLQELNLLEEQRPPRVRRNGREITDKRYKG
tara:strand:- start:311 stop:478 length:168 start_codon:yes stop_codon:yes gene_type:complete